MKKPRRLGGADGGGWEEWEGWESGDGMGEAADGAGVMGGWPICAGKPAADGGVCDAKLGGEAAAGVAVADEAPEGLDGAGIGGVNADAAAGSLHADPGGDLSGGLAGAAQGAGGAGGLGGEGGHGARLVIILEAFDVSGR